MLDKNIVAINRIYHRDGLTIDWFIGKRCNYDCTYCTPDIHDAKSPHIPLEDLKRSIMLFLERFNCDDIKIGFTGGEPCVHPEFHTFCKFLSDNGVFNTTVTTNGSRKAEYYVDLFNYVKSMTFSQHFEHADNSVFLPKVKYITENIDNKWLTVQVMFHANYFEEVKEAVEYYKNNNINYTLRRIRGKGFSNLYSLEYTEEQLQWFFENQPTEGLVNPNAEIFYEEGDIIKSDNVHVNEISGAQLNNFNGWECWAGIEHLHVWWDGTVYRGNCRVGGAIGNVSDPNFTLPTDSVICNVNRCFCAPEIAIKKYKNSNYKDSVN